MTEQDDNKTLPLYVHLYFDEDVPLQIVNNLRNRDLDVLSFRDANMAGSPDDEQMLYAVSQRRAIVTHNRADFEAQHRKFIEGGLKHYGIIIAKRRKPEEVVAKLLEILDSVTADEMENQLRYI